MSHFEFSWSTAIFSQNEHSVWFPSSPFSLSKRQSNGPKWLSSKKCSQTWIVDNKWCVHSHDKSDVEKAISIATVHGSLAFFDATAHFIALLIVCCVTIGKGLSMCPVPIIPIMCRFSMRNMCGCVILLLPPDSCALIFCFSCSAPQMKMFD